MEFKEGVVQEHGTDVHVEGPMCCFDAKEFRRNMNARSTLSEKHLFLCVDVRCVCDDH